MARISNLGRATRPAAGDRAGPGGSTKPVYRTAVRRMMLRTSGSLRAFWAMSYRLLMRFVSGYLLRDVQGAAYVGGSFGTGDPVFGVSDVDLILVCGELEAPGQAKARVQTRWERLRHGAPAVGDCFSEVYVYEDAELADAVSATALTYGIETGEALFLGATRPPDPGWLRLRPGLEPMRGWRLVAGRERRPLVHLAPQALLIAAWLELQFWWRRLHEACSAGDELGLAFLCVKLVAEPARILLHVELGEAPSTRRDVLERARRLVPEEEEAIRAALELSRSLSRRPQASLDDVIPPLLRLSARIAEAVSRSIEAHGSTEVRLVGNVATDLTLARSQAAALQALAAIGATEVMPYGDWQSFVLPTVPDEISAAVDAPVTAEVLARTALLAVDGLSPLLRAAPLHVMPALVYHGGHLRSVQNANTDPVSFALAERRGVARFPNVDGWSTHDTALRAVAEHRAWLAGSDPAELGLRALGRCFTGARAMLLLRSLRAGRPELPLTQAATTRVLAEQEPAHAPIVARALEAFRAARDEDEEPEADIVAAFKKVVADLLTPGHE